MSKSYKIIRIPIEANDALKAKQIAMSDVYKRLTGKIGKLPITQIVTIVSKQPVFMDDQELVSIFRKGRKTRRMIC